MLFMLALFAAHGDPHCPFLLPCYAQFTLFRRLPSSLEKVPLFLFRVLAPEYFLGEIGRNESEGHMQLPSPIQCSVEVKIRGSEPTLINMLDCQILPRGHQYRIIGCDPTGVAFLPLNKERGGGFVVLLKHNRDLLVLTSAEMMWKHVENLPNALCSKIVRLYTTFLSREIVVIDPYSLEVTLLLPSSENLVNYLVPSGNDELFLVEIFCVPDIDRLTCRVSRLHEESGTWVEVTDLGDRVLFINAMGNVSCSAKELPHGCGFTGNSILFTNLPGTISFLFKYGAPTGNAEDNLNCWRSSRENRVVMKLNTSFPLIALQIER